MSSYLSPNVSMALEHASIGYAVFPCFPDKTPRVQWSSESTTDTATIQQWWTQWPDSLVGLDLAKSNTLVVDCDRHGGADGVDAWEFLCTAYNYKTSDNYVVNTPGGGRHIYFSQDPGNVLGNRTGGLPPGIDIRGNGGYVIASGSALPDGRIYETANRGSLPVVPTWLQELIRSKQQKPNRTIDATKDKRAAPAERERRYAVAALKEETNKVGASAEGSRNTTLNTAAFSVGSLIAAGWLDEQDAINELEIAAFTCGLESNEIARTIQSGITAGKEKPRAPLTEWPHGFDMREDGLYVDGGKDNSDWICGPFAVLGEARTLEGNEWSVYIRWHDGDGRLHTHPLPRAELMISSNDVLKPLASGGLKIAPNKVSQLKQCLAHIKTPRRVRIVHRTGWHEETQFVLPTTSIGNDDGREVVIYNGSDVSAAYQRVGNC